MANVQSVKPINPSKEELLAAELESLGFLISEDEEIESRGPALKEHDGELFTTQAGETHAKFSPIPFAKLTAIHNKKGVLSAYRVKIKATNDAGTVKVPVEYTRTDGSVVRGFLLLNSANMYLTLKPRTMAK